MASIFYRVIYLFQEANPLYLPNDLLLIKNSKRTLISLSMLWDEIKIELSRVEEKLIFSFPLDRNRVGDHQPYPILLEQSSKCDFGSVRSLRFCCSYRAREVPHGLAARCPCFNRAHVKLNKTVSYASG